MMNHLPAFGICGYSGSGKTTLILELITQLSARGLKVGVIKHDVHGLDIDRKGKDSDRFFQAGADVLMRGPDQMFLRAHGSENADLEKVLKLVCPYYDILLLEGHKSTPLVEKVWLLKDDGEVCPPEAVNVMRVLRRDEDRPAILMEMLTKWLIEKCLSTPVYAGILIGGNSSRMGRPKHLIEAGDQRTWVEISVSSAKPIVDQVVILGKGEVPASLAHLPLLPDVHDVQGPLAGMLSAMRWRPDVSWIFMSCDMPRITTDAIRWILANRKPGVWAVIPRREAEAKVEPMPGWYDTRSIRLLEECRGPAALADHKKVDTPIILKEFATAWINANTAEDLESLWIR